MSKKVSKTIDCNNLLKSYCLEYSNKDAWKEVQEILKMNDYADRHFLIETISAKEHPWQEKLINSQRNDAIALSVNKIAGQPIILKEGRRYFITYVNYSYSKNQSTVPEDFGRFLHISTSLFQSTETSTVPGFGLIKPQTTISFIAGKAGTYYYCLADHIFTGGFFHIISGGKDTASSQKEDSEDNNDKKDREGNNDKDDNEDNKDKKGKGKIEAVKKPNKELEFSQNMQSDEDKSE